MAETERFSDCKAYNYEYILHEETVEQIDRAGIAHGCSQVSRGGIILDDRHICLAVLVQYDKTAIADLNAEREFTPENACNQSGTVDGFAADRREFLLRKRGFLLLCDRMRVKM